ncbi:MAG: WD40/YVTN/BNR-like repeat-containing protein [Chloroflexota bacterium]
MNTYKRLTLFFMIILVIVAGGCVTQNVLPSPVKPTIVLTQETTAPTETQSSITSTVSIEMATVEYRFSPANLKEYFGPFDIPYHDDFVESQDDGEMRLFVYTLYAIDKDQVFLGGTLIPFAGITYPGMFRRSILLRSTDGGKHWTEVLPTMRASGVHYVTFLDRGEGWALVFGEYVMPTMLWHTVNFGETWDIAGRVSMNGSSAGEGYRALKFSSSTHGDVGFLCGVSPACGEGMGYYAIQSTEDGGKTWTETFRLQMDQVEEDYLFEKRLAAFTAPKGGRYGSNVGYCNYQTRQECPSYGQDGSEWQAEYSQDKMSLLVYKRLALESQWAVYEIPACVEYRAGKMMEPCNDSD